MPEEKIEDLKAETAEEIETPEVKEEIETPVVETAETAEETAVAEESAEATEEVAETVEENASERSLAEAIEIAEATHKTPKKQYNKKGIIAVTALVLVLALMLSIALVNTVSMSDEEYYALYETYSIEIIEDSYNAVIILSARMTYYDENAYIDEYYAEVLVDLENGVAETDAMMKELSNPPSTYEESYELLEVFYDSYMECLDLVLDYGDDADAYVEVATVVIDEFIDNYSTMYEYMMANFLS